MSGRTQEVWKTIEGHDRYEISSLGRVRRDEMLIHGSHRPSGYVTICLKKKAVFVHRLVAQAFCSNDEPEIKVCVNHKNSIRDDNRSSNLEWVSHRENSIHRYRKDNARGLNAKGGIPVIQSEPDGTIVRKWSSATEASKMSEGRFTKWGISMCCSGRLRKHRGYLWQYDFPTIKGEKWKKIEVNHTLIKVSSEGRIKNIRGTPYKQSVQLGYKVIGIRGRLYQAHRLICMAFHPNPDNKMTVDHIDRDPLNNKASNLRWFTPAEQTTNRKFSHKNMKNRKLVSMNVFTEDGGMIIRIYKGIRQAANDQGICPNIIRIRSNTGRRDRKGRLWIIHKTAR